MSRPNTKPELYEAIQLERGKLNKALEKLIDDQMALPGACDQWAVKDILMHLVDWEQRCLRWYRAGLKGEVPKTPDDNFNWRELPALNHEIYLKHQDLSLADVHQKYQASFKELLAVIADMTEEELFTPHYYEWTGNGLLRDYVNANTASHYRWAGKLIRKFTKSIG